MEARSLAALYKKVKLCEGVYIYRFIQVVEPIFYDGIRDTIQYVKNGTVKEVPDMENIEFTLSDEKLCFSDMIEIETLKEDYETDDFNQIKEQFAKELVSFVRYGVIDSESNMVKIVQSNMEAIQSALPDSDYLEYSSYSFNDEVCVSFPLDLLKRIVSNLNDGEVEMVKEQLDSIAHDVENKVETNESDMFDEEEDDMPLPIPATIIDKNKDSLSQLNQMIGLNSIKDKLYRLRNFLEFNQRMKEHLNIKMPNMNMVFTGNPGTGKTTVARLVAELLYQNSIIKSPKFAECTAQNFIAGYVGQTAIKTRKALETNRGGVIFIDEAYAFTAKAQDFADEALVEILKEMETGKTVFIFAGYPEEMKNFIEMNPGLKSRVGYYIDFPNYTVDELWQIFVLKATACQFRLSDNLEEKVKTIFSQFLSKPKFGNGRFVDQLLERMIVSHATRMVGVEDLQELCTLSGADIDASVIEEFAVKMKNKKMGF